jgi:hypothetical protein
MKTIKPLIAASAVAGNKIVAPVTGVRFGG